MDLALNNHQWLMCHKTKPNTWNYNCLYMIIISYLRLIDSKMTDFDIEWPYKCWHAIKTTYDI